MMQRECDEEDLMKSWKMLFTFYKDVHCDTEKKPIIQILRRSLNKIVRDIVDHLVKIVCLALAL